MLLFLFINNRMKNFKEYLSETRFKYNPETFKHEIL